MKLIKLIILMSCIFMVSCSDFYYELDEQTIDKYSSCESRILSIDSSLIVEKTEYFLEDDDVQFIYNIGNKEYKYFFCLSFECISDIKTELTISFFCKNKKWTDYDVWLFSKLIQEFSGNYYPANEIEKYLISLLSEEKDSVRLNSHTKLYCNDWGDEDPDIRIYYHESLKNK